jgi:DNA-directed RNA polymerase subunit beta'
MPTTLGHLLVNEILPVQHRGQETLEKKNFNKKLLAIAKEDPTAYVDIVSRLKRVGDELSTLEGMSVGLDDIAPVYETRDAIMKPAMEVIKKATTSAEREKIILDVQDKMMAHTKSHPGTMTVMAHSGARGNFPQLMKTVASPVAAVDAKGAITPWLIGKSYSEGLSAADYWVAGNEARINTVKSSTSVAEPGDLAKILVNNLYPYVIVKDDCGTHNGLAMSSSDGHVVDRYLAKDAGPFKYNTLVTPQVAQKLKTVSPEIYVRSPMTCDAYEGVCRKCQGLDEKGKSHAIGVNVGVRAAQALSEPLTQFALNAKHGVRVLKGASQKLDGLSGFRQLLEIPQSFFNKATLAERAGKVTKIVPAPHGGNYVYVEGVEHYTSPNLKVVVQEGQTVEAGDVLSDGIPKPDELVYHKGFGAGRQYLVEQLHNIYNTQGTNMDKRHLELIARAELSHVKVLEASPEHPTLLRGDVIHYNDYRDAVGQKTRQVPLTQAEGLLLGKETLHYTAGTRLTKSILDELKSHGVKTLDVSDSAPAVEFMMKPMTRNPLLNPDWMARLAHRYLKDSVLKGAHFGDASDLHGAHPVPAYAYGAEFGNAPDGKY